MSIFSLICPNFAEFLFIKVFEVADHESDIHFFISYIPVPKPKSADLGKNSLPRTFFLHFFAVFDAVTGGGLHL